MERCNCRKAELLESVSKAGAKLFASYLKDASTRVYQYSYEGKPEREIKLPAIGTASGFEGIKTIENCFILLLPSRIRLRYIGTK